MAYANGVDVQGHQSGYSSRVTTEIYAKLTMTPEVRGKYLLLYEGGAYKNSFRAADESQHR